MLIKWQGFVGVFGLVFAALSGAQTLPIQPLLLAQDQVCVTVQCKASSASLKNARTPQQATSSEVNEANNCITVTGTASSENVDEAFARQMAIRNGLNFASLNNNVTVFSDQSVENHALTRTKTRFTSSSKVESYKILSEGFEEAYDTYGEEKTRPLN